MKKYYTHMLYELVKRLDNSKEYNYREYLLETKTFFMDMHNDFLKHKILLDDYFMLSRLGTQLLRNREQHIKFIL